MKKYEQGPLADDKKTIVSNNGDNSVHQSGTPPFTVDLNRPEGEGKTPLQPHERDQSTSSAEVGNKEPREVMKQAYKDIEQGQVDTDLREQRGVEKTVDKAFKPATSMPERKQERS